MASMSAADPGSWQVDVVDRERRLASTLRSLVATAAVSPEAPWGADLLAAAARLDSGSVDVADMASLVSEIEATRTTVAQNLLPQPLLAARRVTTALERVQAATTWADVLRTAPAELCWAGDFDRVLFSRIEGSSWLPATWHVTTDAGSPANVAFGRFARGATIALTNGMIEAEIVRRRVTGLVGDALGEPRTFPPLVEIALSRAYVIAPVVSGDAVVGLFHADAYATGRPLAESDRATVRAFADGVGLLLERLALHDRLQLQRKRIAEALAAAEQVVDELCVAPVLLGAEAEHVVRRPLSRAEVAPDDGLTAREREVFSLLVGGATNAQIANRLTVSETTVKSHVKHILRKLGASNRVEAIARYLAMSSAQGVPR